MEKIQEEEGYCYKFNQPGLIDNILEATDMKKCNRKPTPTISNIPLGQEMGSKLAKSILNIW
eukprot:12138442-Ditylum_brightwellii.AAC.1